MIPEAVDQYIPERPEFINEHGFPQRYPYVVYDEMTTTKIVYFKVLGLDNGFGVL